MQQQRVRRIQVSNYAISDRQWDEGWLDPALARLKRIAAYWAEVSHRHASSLVRLGVAASILGGFLWSLSFGLLYLGEASYDYSYVLYFDYRIDNLYISTWMLEGAMLLYMSGLIGLYQHMWQVGKTGRLARAGLLLSVVATTFYLVTDLLPLLDGEQDEYIFNLFWIPPPVVASYFSKLPGLLMLSLSLALFGIHAIKTRTLPVLVWIVLNVVSMAIHVIAFALLRGYRADDEYAVISGAFTSVMMLFGICWIWLGFALWTRGSKVET